MENKLEKRMRKIDKILIAGIFLLLSSAWLIMESDFGQAEGAALEDWGDYWRIFIDVDVGPDWINRLSAMPHVEEVFTELDSTNIHISKKIPREDLDKYLKEAESIYREVKDREIKSKIPRSICTVDFETGQIIGYRSMRGVLVPFPDDPQCQ